jgi:MFS family permease
MAIGFLGMGSGLGFFFGPQYAGWRAVSATWHWGQIADWQRPCIEMGAAGLLVGILFLLLAHEPRRKRERRSDDQDGTLPNRVSIEAIVTDMQVSHGSEHAVLTPSLRNRVLLIATALSFRDFAGIATISLLSIFLQKAHGYSPQHAGLVVGGMTLISIVVNPLSVYLSPGKRRLPGLAFVLILGGLSLLGVPWLPAVWVLPVMCVFQAFQFASYAISDAALLERVAASVRGRVVGLFLMIAGTFASLSPWAMGFWSDLLKERAADPVAYFPIFATLCGMMFLASISPRLFHKLNQTSDSTESLEVVSMAK